MAQVHFVKKIFQGFGVVACLCMAGVGAAEKTDFQKRWKSLVTKKNSGHMNIVMTANDDPAVLPGKKAGGYTVVSTTRSGFLPPPSMLAPEDVSAVVSSKHIDIRKCYKKQLKENAEWSDRLILDIAINKSGRVGEVDVSPGRVKRDIMGRCRIRSVAKWRFPEFTGTLDGGIQQDVMNASIPFSFGTR